jgi:outer membrane immunogenic protein
VKRKWMSAVAVASAIVSGLVSAAGTLQASDWTGGYVGAQAGQANSDGASGGAAAELGLHGGYNVDYGGLVLGGEFEFARMQLAQRNGAEVLSNVSRIKLRAGRDFGTTMAYAVMGGVNGTAPAGNETGLVFGIGVATRVGEYMTLSTEALRQVFDNYANGPSSLKTDSFSVRVSFRF